MRALHSKGVTQHTVYSTNLLIKKLSNNMSLQSILTIISRICEFAGSTARNLTMEHNITDLSMYFDACWLPRLSHEQGETVAVLCMLALFILTGVIGNSLVLYVYAFNKDKQPIANHFMVVLAVVDLCTCVVVMPATMYLEYNQFETSVDFLCKGYMFLITTVIPFSVFILVAISVDRYLCICCPFLHVMTLLRAKIITVVLAAVAFVMGAVVALAFGVKQERPRHCHDATSATIVANESHIYIVPSNETDIVNVGICAPNNMIVGTAVIGVYQYIHSSVYVLCLVVIITLYSLIYRLVRERRRRRMQQQGTRMTTLNRDSTFSAAPVTDVTTEVGRPCIPRKAEVEKCSPGLRQTLAEEQEPLEGGRSGCTNGAGGSTSSAPANPFSAEHARENRENRMRRANLKTAMMLFVVTLVFVLTYMPAFVMVLLGRTNRILHNFYFANNVANPVIYSFMNQNFRDDLNRIFRKRK